MAVISFPLAGGPVPLEQSLVDGEQRLRALDTSASWIVEAPAGSGKTGLLIQRYLKLLAAANDPAEIIALTFTEKAAAEMRARVTRALRHADDAAYEPDGESNRLTHQLARAVIQQDAVRGWRLGERPYQLEIRTIDSLCHEIARAVPLLGGGVGFARPLRDPGLLYRRAAHAVTMRFGGEDFALNDALHTLLLHRDGNLGVCEGTLAAMLRDREHWSRLIPLEGDALTGEALDRDVLPRLNGALERTLCAALTRLHRCFPEEHLARLASIARQLAHAEGYKEERSPFAPCAQLPGSPGAGAEHHHHWILIAQLLLKKDGDWRARFARSDIRAVATLQTQSELKDLVSFLSGSGQLRDLLNDVLNLPAATYPPEQWRLAKALFRLLRYALDALEELFAREEVCDFTAISLAAHSALKQDGLRNQVLRTAPRHLLVDEMQDTSSTQYELLEALTVGWDGRLRTVFLVGDPKQSIYLFRQARVDLFQRAMTRARLGNIPLGVLGLRTNFRSGSHLVRRFNETFTRVFPSDEPGEGDVTYAPATAAHPAKHHEEMTVSVDPLPNTEGNTEASRQQRRRAI